MPSIAFTDNTPVYFLTAARDIGLEIVASGNADIYVVSTPGFMEALRKVESLRETGRTAIVFATSEIPEWNYKLLKAGADDVQSAKADPRELRARFQTLLRRDRVRENPAKKAFSLGSYVFYPETGSMVGAGKTIEMPPVQSKILTSVLGSGSDGASVGRLMSSIWPEGSKDCLRLLRVHISRINRKINEEAVSAAKFRIKNGRACLVMSETA